MPYNKNGKMRGGFLKYMCSKMLALQGSEIINNLYQMVISQE